MGTSLGHIFESPEVELEKANRSDVICGNGDEKLFSDVELVFFGLRGEVGVLLVLLQKENQLALRSGAAVDNLEKNLKKNRN